MDWECQVCGAAAPLACPGCETMFYCSEKHIRRHARVGHDAEECARMAMQRRRTAELQRLPFDFAAELTAGVDAGTASVCGFLQRHGLHGCGLWRRQCACEAAAPWGSLAPRSSADDEAELLQGLLALPPPPLEAPSCAPPEDAGAVPPLRGWKDYYALRGLPSSSPAALLLEGPLTLCSSLMRACGSRSLPQCLVVHLLGPQKELDEWPAYTELARLLPGHSIDLLLVGPDVPPATNAHTVALADGRLRLTFCRGLYHDLCAQLSGQLGRPDLIFAPNAGLAAYASWAPTLRALPPGVPCIFTDYCEEAALRGIAMAQALAGPCVTVPVAANPFRRPVSRREARRDNALPSFSNGFSFTIQRE